MRDYIEIQARKKAHELVLLVFKDKGLNSMKSRIANKLKDAVSNVPAELFEAHVRFTDIEKIKYVLRARENLQEIRYYVGLLKDLKEISAICRNKYFLKIDLLDKLLIIMIKNGQKKETSRGTRINYFYKFNRVN